MNTNPRQRKALSDHRAFSTTTDCKQQSNNKPQHCKHFDRCNAPICPLDSDWRQRTHLENEHVCIFLRELAKPSGKDLLSSHLQAITLELIEEQVQEISQHHGDIKRRLERASKCGSKIGNGKALNGESHG